MLFGYLSPPRVISSVGSLLLGAGFRLLDHGEIEGYRIGLVCDVGEGVHAQGDKA